MPKRMLVFALLLPVLLHAQHGFIKLHNLKYAVSDTFISVGTKLKVKEISGEKTVGKLDTVYADAFVVNAKVIMNDSVKHLSWKKFPTKKGKRQLIIGIAGAGLAVAGIMIGALTLSSHDQSSEQLGGIALSIGVPALLVSPFFLIPGYIKTCAWHGKHIGKNWQITGVPG